MGRRQRRRDRENGHPEPVPGEPLFVQAGLAAATGSPPEHPEPEETED